MYLNVLRSSSTFSRTFHLLTAFLVAEALFSTIVTAAPIDSSPDDDNDTDPLPIPVLPNLYPDLNECRRQCHIEPNKSMFYSRVGPHEEKPQDFANQNGLKLVREAFPPGFTDKNPLLSGYKKFADRFSQAFAEKTAGTAYVMLPTDGTPIDRRTWTVIEKPILTASGGKCNKIIKVDPDNFHKRCVLFDRSGRGDLVLPSCHSENGPIPNDVVASAGGLAPLEESSPSSSSENSPAPSGETTPAPEGQTSPAPAEEDSPAPKEQSRPTSEDENSPSPSGDNSLVPDAENSPASSEGN